MSSMAFILEFATFFSPISLNAPRCYQHRKTLVFIFTSDYICCPLTTQQHVTQDNQWCKHKNSSPISMHDLCHANLLLLRHTTNQTHSNTRVITKVHSHPPGCCLKGGHGIRAAVGSGSEKRRRRVWARIVLRGACSAGATDAKNCGGDNEVREDKRKRCPFDSILERHFLINKHLS